MTTKNGSLAALFKYGNNIDVPARIKAEMVILPDSDNVSFDIADGNVAIYERNGVTTNSTLTLSNSGGSKIDGMGFMIMTFNNDDNDSDRTLTLAADGLTIDFSGDSAETTWTGGKKTVFSGIIYDSDNVILGTMTTDKVIT